MRPRAMCSATVIAPRKNSLLPTGTEGGGVGWAVCMDNYSTKLYKVSKVEGEDTLSKRDYVPPRKRKADVDGKVDGFAYPIR